MGATLAYATLIRGVAHDVVLYDMAKAKVEAEVLDLRHGLQFCPPADVDGSDDIAVCANADVIATLMPAEPEVGVPVASRLTATACDCRSLRLNVTV